MKILNTLLLGTLLFFNIAKSIAQEDPNPLTVTQALQQEKIEKQFDYLIKKSNRFQEFKVVKRIWLDKLKSNTIDSLRVFEEKLLSTNQQLAKQEQNIKNLKEALKEANNKLENVTNEKDNINFLGIGFTKTSYKTLMWSIAGILLGLLLFFIYKFKNSNTVTVAAKKGLTEIEAEFEEHRRRALEREQKLNRKLQDEINKQRNKTGA